MNEKIKPLDGLRGFAALLVVFSHTSLAGMYFAPYFNFSGFGKFGVFLFFLLSSFLLTIPFIRLGSSAFNKATFSRYWQRRFLEYFPCILCIC